MDGTSILLVEDERIVALNLKTSLKKLGYAVVGVASTGEDAIIMTGELRPKLILMDIQLGGQIDGIEAALEIERMYDTPVVYITAHSDDHTVGRARDSGQYGFVSKTADERSLHSAIQMAVEQFSRESKLRENHAQLSATIGTIGDAVLRLDGNGVIVGWDGNASGVFGYASDEVKNKHITCLATRYSFDEVANAIERVRNGLRCPRFEALLAKADGTRVLASVKVSELYDPNGRIHGITVVASDITERRIVEKAVLDISDRERTRIGQDLHDGLGQKLTGIALSLKALETQAHDSEPILASELGKVYGQVKQAIAETRQLSKGLIPPSLRRDGLAVALESLVSAPDPGGPELTFENDLDEEIGDGFIETQLYRIAQEAITNALRHGNCQRVSVSLQRSGEELLLTVQDDGNGIRAEENGGLGMRIMGYRSDAISGKLEVESNSTGGTAIECRVRLMKWEDR